MLLYRLIHGPIKPKKVYALVRGHIDKLPAFLHPFVGNQLCFTTGDSAAPKFGLSDTLFEELLDSVDIVIHAASDTRLDRTALPTHITLAKRMANDKATDSLYNALHVNVTMAQNLCAFSIAAPNVKTHIHVSSAFVNHWLPDGSTSHESLDQKPSSPAEIDACLAKPHYQSKAMAEAVVDAFAAASSSNRSNTKSKVAFVNLRLSSIAPALVHPEPAYGSLLRAAQLCAVLASTNLTPGDLPTSTRIDSPSTFH